MTPSFAMVQDFPSSSEVSLHENHKSNFAVVSRAQIDDLVIVVFRSVCVLAAYYRGR